MYRNKCEIYIWIELEGSEVIKFRNERVLITFEISCICWVFITVFFCFHFRLFSFNELQNITRIEICTQSINKEKTLLKQFVLIALERSSLEMHSTKG